MQVSIVIPNWNGGAMLARCLHSIKNQTYAISEILVVDNKSSDGSDTQAEHAGARVIRLNRNYGFAKAVNRGIEECRTDLTAVLNNDVTLEPGWLASLVDAFQNLTVWFSSGKILSATNPAIIDATFDAVCRGGCAWRCGAGRPDAAIWNEPRTIALAPFTAAVFRTELFQRIGMLDERFESYLEDVDFGIRCASQGYTGAYVPAAVAHHVGS